MLSSGRFSTDARDVLRLATAEVHQRLHGLAGFRAILAGTIAPVEYRRLLELLYGFHSPLEDALIATHEPWPVAMEQRRRADRLRDDLRVLGLGMVEIDCLPRVAPPKSLDRPGRYLGCLYVREGSMLGGKVLASRLDSILPPFSLAGRGFFAGGANDVAMWNSLCAAIEDGAAAGALDDMVEAATDTFVTFEQWMTQNGEAAQAPDERDKIGTGRDLVDRV